MTARMRPDLNSFPDPAVKGYLTLGIVPASVYDRSVFEPDRPSE